MKGNGEMKTIPQENNMKIYRKIPSLKFMYEIDQSGNVRNVKSKKHLKWHIHYKNGRASVCAQFKGKKVYPLVHRLVAETWLKEWNPELTVDHIDNNPLNNDVSNLQMMTLRENYRKGYNDGLILGNPSPQQKVVMINTKTNKQTLFKGAKEAAEYIKQTYPE